MYRLSSSRGSYALVTRKARRNAKSRTIFAKEYRLPPTPWFLRDMVSKFLFHLLLSPTFSCAVVASILRVHRTKALGNSRPPGAINCPTWCTQSTLCRDLMLRSSLLASRPFPRPQRTVAIATALQYVCWQLVAWWLDSCPVDHFGRWKGAHVKLPTHEVDQITSKMLCWIHGVCRTKWSCSCTAAGTSRAMAHHIRQFL